MVKILLLVILLSGCSNIPVDKRNHFIVGAMTSGIVFKFTGDKNLSCTAAMAAGIMKELYDAQHKQKHNVEVADAVATMLGCLVWRLFD